MLEPCSQSGADRDGRELLIALGWMVFLWGGKYALEVMHLRQESVSIAGGIVLFLIGIRMIFPPPEGLMGELPEGEPFIVPMAIPLVAGPSGMAAVMLMGSDDPTRLGDGQRADGGLVAPPRSCSVPPICTAGWARACSLRSSA